MWRCPECEAFFYNKDAGAPVNTCDFCKGTFKKQEGDLMALGGSHIIADRSDRLIGVKVGLNTKGKALENAGILATITNEIHDVLRKHFCAHQIKVVAYREALPAKRKNKKVIR